MAKKAAAKQEQPFIEKTVASVDEIAHQWGGTHPLETVVSIISRLKTGQFKFQAPKELTADEKPEERISLGADFLLSDFSFLYKIEDLICQRCAWYIKNGKEYQQPNYEAIFAGLAKLNFDLAGKLPGTEYMVWERCLKNIQALILPPDMVNEKSEEEVADALRKLLLGQTDAAQKEKIDNLSADEIVSMQLMLAKHLYLSKDVFFHWLRLERHKLNPHSSKPYKGEYQLPDYNQFWGDEWAGQPQPWKPDTDESHGLILADAFKFYSDPHDWAEYEAALKAAEKLGLGEGHKAYEKAEQIKSRLRSRFISLFHPAKPLLKAQGYTDKPEPQDLSYVQLKTMLDGKRLNVDDSRGGIGQLGFEQITVMKASAPVPIAVPVKANKYNLGTAEANTLFKLVAGMAKVGYGYNEAQERNDATADIVKDTGVDHKTAKKWIEFAIEQTSKKDA